MTKIYIVCYPGGAGGSFVSSALQSVLFGSNFCIDPERGHCHNNSHVCLPNIHHGDSIKSFEQELTEIKQLRLSPSSVYSCHYRNLVAIYSMCFDTQGWELAQNMQFIKINVKPRSDHVTFLTKMLRQKVKSFPDLPLEEFRDLTQLYIESWYWIENSRTIATTTNLDLTDIFTLGLENKFQHHLTENQLEQFAQYHRDYIAVQHSLYPDLITLLNAKN